jgi:glucose/arabinose dehydrogenase
MPGHLHGFRLISGFLLAGLVLAAPIRTETQTLTVRGRVVDATGQPLPGVTVQVVSTDLKMTRRTVTGPEGRYEVSNLPSGSYEAVFSAMNFAEVRRRHVAVTSSAPTQIDVTLHISLSSDVLVTAKSTFRNLAELPRPEDSLVGVANAASEGAVTARQIETRAIQRAGEVLESVPGMIVSQHGGEGKANQFYLRGFNLDHGTDFLTRVAGVPVNLPTHGHGHG